MTSPVAVPILVAASEDAAQRANRPDYQRPEYQALAPDRALCRALVEGARAIHAGGTMFLPKWPEEKPEHYQVRASMTTVAKYYARTCEAAVGMICATPPALAKDAPAIIADDWRDVDGQGTHGEVFARQIALEAIHGGFAAVLLDAPPIPDGLSLTLADEQALGLRPFWVPIPADRLLSWIVDVPDWPALLTDYADGVLDAAQVAALAKQTVVRQVVIHEPADVPQGTFGIACVDRYRVLALTPAGVTFTVWEKVPAQGATAEHFVQRQTGLMLGAKRAPLRAIPLAVIYAGRKHAPFVAPPAFLGLAQLNLDHYQVSADRRYLMRLCHAPTLFLAGIVGDMDEQTGQRKPIKVGPNSVIASPDPAAKAGYVAADPGALDSSQVEKQEIVQQMASLGMSFLAKDRRGSMETATGRALDDAAENATHATIARALQDGLEQALGFHALYRGVPAPSVTVDTTYAAPSVDPQIAAVLWQAVLADKLDVASWITYITTGDLPDDVATRVQMLALVAKANEADQTAADTASADTTKTTEAKTTEAKTTASAATAGRRASMSGVAPGGVEPTE